MKCRTYDGIKSNTIYDTTDRGAAVLGLTLIPHTPTQSFYIGTRNGWSYLWYRIWDRDNAGYVTLEDPSSYPDNIRRVALDVRRLAILSDIELIHIPSNDGSVNNAATAEWEPLPDWDFRLKGPKSQDD